MTKKLESMSVSSVTVIESNFGTESKSNCANKEIGILSSIPIIILYEITLAKRRYSSFSSKIVGLIPIDENPPS